MTKRRAAFVAIAGDDSTDNEDIDKITSYCERCKEFNFLYKLGPRIYHAEGPKPYDSDKWLQCYNCGQITPRIHAKQENEISPIVDPPDTIHDSNNVTVLATNSSKKRRAMINNLKKNRIGYNRSSNYEDKDPDLHRMIKQGKQLVSYTEGKPT